MEGSTSEGVVFVELKQAPRFGVPEVVVLAPTALQQYLKTFLRGLSAESSREMRWRLLPRSEVACREFASLVRAIPQVQSVHASAEGERVHIWTYLDERPFDRSLRYKIYGAEEEVIRRFPECDFEFRLLNLSEYDPQTWPVLPLEGEPLYQREADAG